MQAVIHRVFPLAGRFYRLFTLSWFKDPRINQILFLSSFLLFGIALLGWEKDIGRYLVTIATCLLTQAFFTYFTNKNFSSLKSGLITSLSLCLLFKAVFWPVIFLAAFLAIASKFIIRVKGKHIFNPANFGIMMAIILTGEAWISPGQWGSSKVMMAFFLITGTSVLLKCGRMDTGMVFLATFTALQFAYQVLYLHWPVDFFFHQLSNGTLLLFSFFMITDPVTTPNSPKARIIWAVLVGITAFVLSRWLFVHTAPLWALFIISPLTVLLDRIFIQKRFKWISSS